VDNQDTLSLGSPPTGAQLGPLPPRSATSLRLQFCIQPLFTVIYLGLIVAVLILGAAGGGSVGSAGDLGPPRSLFLSPRRYRLERGGKTAEWTTWAHQLIVEATTSAETRGQRRRLKKRWTAKRPEVCLEVRDYRGLGATGVAALASDRGWAVDWTRSPRPDRHLILVGATVDSD
jgi:hypothetical protein